MCLYLLITNKFKQTVYLSPGTDNHGLGRDLNCQKLSYVNRIMWKFAGCGASNGRRGVGLARQKCTHCLMFSAQCLESMISYDLYHSFVRTTLRSGISCLVVRINLTAIDFQHSELTVMTTDSMANTSDVSMHG